MGRKQKTNIKDVWGSICIYLSIIHGMFSFIYRILKKKPKTYKYNKTDSQIQRTKKWLPERM